MLGSVVLGVSLLAACSSTLPPASGVPVLPAPEGPAAVTPPQGESPFVQVPDLATCQPGSLKPAIKAALLERINRFRAQHGLSGVHYDDSKEGAAQAAALMMGANLERPLTHTPDPSYRCYSALGRSGAEQGGLSRGSSTGGLGITASPLNMVDRFLSELNSNHPSGDLASIGHRRWLLNPFLKRVALGWVQQQSGDSARYSGSIWWTDGDDFQQPTSSATDFVAYPHGDYPAEAFDPNVRLSFSVLADKSSLWNNDLSRVDLSGARVEMSGGVTVQGLARAVYNPANLQDSTEGLPNVLVWRAGGMQRNTPYTVRVLGVRVKAGGTWQERSFEYSFVGR